MTFGGDAFDGGVGCARARRLGRCGRGAARARRDVGDARVVVVVVVVVVVDARGGHHGREHWIGL